MSSDVAIRVQNLGKCYHIYNKPQDRLKQALLPQVRRIVSPVLKVLGKGRQPRAPYFREFWALKDVSFEIERGGCLGIIGGNGSGKSTLLQLIAGTLAPTSGSVEVTGRTAALLELGSGFNPEFTGRENVYMNACLLGLGKDEINARFEDIAAFADIGEFIEQPVKTYSSGMLVRLAFAVQSVIEPDVLIVDEALAVGDMRFSMKCIRKMRELIEKGTSCLFVSHDMSSVVNFCNEVVWLHDGRIVEKGEPRTVTLNYANFMSYGFLPPHEHEHPWSKHRGGTGTVSNRLRHRRKNETGAEDSPPLEDLQWHVVSGLPSIGDGGATITRVSLFSLEHNAKHALFSGGESVEMLIEIACKTDLKSPVVCADFRDRKGNLVFGLNTLFLVGVLQPFLKGSGPLVRFKFELPLLLNGEYSISLAIADGSLQSHIQHHIIHDALVVTVASEDLPRHHYLTTLKNAQCEILSEHL